MSNQLAAVAPLLREMGIIYAYSKFGPAAIHMRGRSGTALATLDVYVHEADLGVFAREIQCHAEMPPLWELWLQQKASHPIDWTWGFQEARRQLLPRKGVFKPSIDLKPMEVCATRRPEIQAARQLGMLTYLRELAQAEAKHQIYEERLVLNAAD